ncbi:UNVERIFIED_CONTAM: hypothetical protein FKN15_011618 [Acipenser sinensis]
MCRLLLWDCDDRSYSYYIEVSTNQQQWTKVIDRTKGGCRCVALSLLMTSENVATIAACASVIEGVSRSRNALLNGDTKNYDWDSGYTCHQLGSGAIVVQLAQPYMIGSIRLLLWDCDDRSYSYYIEVSTNQQQWTKVIDRTKGGCRNLQIPILCTLDQSPARSHFYDPLPTKNRYYRT